jgi:hypothetical protein
MRITTMLVVAMIAVAVSIAIYSATGGHLVFFFLPLLFALPFAGRRRR